MRFNTTTVFVALALSTSVLAITKGKRGLVFNNPPTYIKQFDGSGTQVSWAYDWDSYMDPDFPSYLEFVPMLWSNLSVHTSQWVKNANAALARGTGALLSFNEPDGDGAGQANMTPAQAVEVYRQYMSPFGNRALLGAPAVTNGPTGLPWLKEFIKLCVNCKIDFVPIHWYDAWWNEGYLGWYVNQSHYAAGGRKIWITELHAAGTTAQQTTFLKWALPWLDKQTYIDRYSWYWANPGYTAGTVVESSGAPSALGEVYAYTPY